MSHSLLMTHLEITHYEYLQQTTRGMPPFNNEPFLLLLNNSLMTGDDCVCCGYYVLYTILDLMMNNRTQI